MTLAEIKAKLIETGEPCASVLEETLSTLGSKSPDDMTYYLHNGYVTEDKFDAYCYLWRNMAIRLSSVLEGYELSSLQED